MFRWFVRLLYDSTPAEFRSAYRFAESVGRLSAATKRLALFDFGNMLRSADVLLLGGDFVSYRDESVTTIANALPRCKPPLGTFAVLGNHDLWTDDRQISRQLSACGVEVLVNRNGLLKFPFDVVSICGIDDPWTGSLILRRPSKLPRPFTYC
jgi:predicted MPP superfamily phosphohydrolase